MATGASDAAIGPESAAREMIGPVVSLSGNAAIGPVEVARSSTRDTVVVFYQDSDHELFAGSLWILDGPTAQIHHFYAWDWVFTQDGASIVFGEHVSLDLKRDTIPSTKQRRAVAARIGVPEIKEKEVRYSGGSPYVVQVVIMELTTGTVRKLPLIGGATLAPYESRILGLMTPIDPSVTDSEPSTPRLLDSNKTRWRPLPESQRKMALQALEHRYGITPEWRDGEGAPPGTVLITTKDGNVGLVMVGYPYEIQAFRQRR